MTHHLKNTAFYIAVAISFIVLSHLFLQAVDKEAEMRADKVAQMYQAQDS